MRKTAKFFIGRYGFPILLFVLALFTYTLHIGELGYYLDDWASIAAFDQGGEAGMIAYGIDDSRPFEAWVMAKCFALLGTAPLTWQIIAVLSRYLAGLACWSILRRMWPEQTQIAVISAILFCLFPFFKHQAICIAYFIILFQYCVVLFSFYLTVVALQSSSRIISSISYALSLATSLFHLACIEYYLSLEAVRFLLIFFVLEKEHLPLKKRIVRTILIYIPFGLIIIGVLGYRFIYVPTLSDDVRPIAFSYTGINLILHLLGLAFQYLIESIFGVWYRSFSLTSINFSLPFTRQAMAFGVICAGIVFLLFYQYRTENSDKSNSKKDCGELLILGICATLLGFLPGMMINVSPASTNTYHDRYLIPGFWGISITVATLLVAVLRTNRQKSLCLAVLIFICVFFQIQNSYMYTYSHQYQELFQWGMKERIPDITEDTAIIGDGVIASFTGGWSDGAMVFEMYGKKQGVSPTSYWYFSASDEDLLPILQSEEPIIKDVKMFQFSAQAENVLIVTKPEFGKCVWLLNEDDLYNPYLESGIGAYIPYQNKSRILINSEHSMPESVFGKEAPEHWCTFFEKADFALDLSDYDRVLSLYEEADKKGFHPENPIEMRPFILAAAAKGDHEQANAWIEQARKMDSGYSKTYFDHLSKKVLGEQAQ